MVGIGRCNDRERGVLKCTLVVDNDRTVHGVHTDTVAFQSKHS